MPRALSDRLKFRPIKKKKKKKSLRERERKRNNFFGEINKKINQRRWKNRRCITNID